MADSDVPKRRFMSFELAEDCTTHKGDIAHDKVDSGLTSSSHISSLPPTVLVRIFSALDALGKCKAAQVCRSWQVLMKEKCLWVDIDLRSSHRLVPVSKVIQFMRSYSLGSALKRFKCNAADNRVLEHLQAHCQNLDELVLESGSYRDLELDLIPTAKLIHLQLRPLDADQYPEDWWDFFTPERFPVLKRLGLHEPDPVDMVMREVCKIQSLTRLQLDTLPMWPLKTEAIMNIAKLTDLEELCLKSVYSSNTEELVTHISRGLEKLKVLDLSLSEFVQGEALGGLSRLPCLETIKLNGCRRVTFRHLKDLAVALPHLKHLHYSVCPISRQVSNTIILDRYAHIKSLAPYLHLYYNDKMYKGGHQKLYDNSDAAWAELCSFRREQQDDLDRPNPCRGWNSSPGTSDDGDDSDDGGWGYNAQPVGIGAVLAPSSSDSEDDYYL